MVIKESDDHLMIGPYMERPLTGTTPVAEDIITTLLPLILRRGCPSRDKWKADSKLVAIRIKKSSAAKSTVLGLLTCVPTLLI